MRGVKSPFQRALGRIRNDAAREELERRVHALEQASTRLSQRVDDAREHMHAVADRSVELAREHTDAATQASADHVLAVSREHAEAASRAAAAATLDSAREHAEAASAELVALTTQNFEALEQRVQTSLATTRRELRAMSRSRPAASTEQPKEQPGLPGTDQPTIDPALYAALEDRFRGASAEIERRLQVYVEHARAATDAAFPLLDLGCGRGEWLRVLAAHGVPASGIDTNSAFVADLVDAGLDASEGELFDVLRQRPDGSLGAISMFHVVEHLPFPRLVDVLSECVRTLRAGGLLIVETPNATNLRVAASTFWLDPTHQRPLHPELLEFVAHQCGFTKTEQWFLNPLDPDRPPTAEDRLATLVDGPGDFALLAWA